MGLKPAFFHGFLGSKGYMNIIKSMVNAGKHSRNPWILLGLCFWISGDFKDVLIRRFVEGCRRWVYIWYFVRLIAWNVSNVFWMQHPVSATCLLVVWVGGLDIWISLKGLLVRGTPWIPNHQPKPPIYHWLIQGKLFISMVDLDFQGIDSRFSKKNLQLKRVSDLREKGIPGLRGEAYFRLYFWHEIWGNVNWKNIFP